MRRMARERVKWTERGMDCVGSWRSTRGSGAQVWLTEAAGPIVATSQLLEARLRSGADENHNIAAP